MALPTALNNIVGSHVYPIADLGMVASVPNATPVVSTAFSTGLPGSVVVLATLSSGTATINARVDDTAAHAVANIGTPTASVTMSATGVGYYLKVDTSDNATTQMQDYSIYQSQYVAPTSSLFVALQQVGAASGAIFSNLAVFTLFELVGGEDWYSIQHGGLNAVGGVVGISGVTPTNPTGYQDGSGVVTITPA